MKIKIHCDGGSRGNPGRAASAFVVYDESNNIIFEEGKNIGVSTNNVAEYHAVLMALEWLQKQKNINYTIPFFLDSQLVVNQLVGIYKIKDSTLISIAKKIKDIEKSLGFKISFKHIYRNLNKDADLLVNKTLDLNS